MEVEELEVASGQQSKRKTTGEVNGNEKEAERKRVVGLAERLMGDLRRYVLLHSGLGLED